ncbi:MAG: DUF6446 family protein [Pseudomonadota bacterium]
MSGKLIGIFLVGIGVIAGIALYILQVYVFFDEVPADDVTIRLTLVATDAPDPLLVENLEAIDGTSSPLKFRACFDTAVSMATLTETYVVIDNAVPLTAPGWFDCFDADAIGAALSSGQAVAYLGEREIRDGVDRVVAILDDGRGFAWHQLNEKFSE